jgi:hypothetical protein
MSHRFARLSGLAPNTAYYFVIRDNEGVSPRIWFKTAPADGAAGFTLVAGGDSRNNRAPRQNANRIVSKLRPLAVLFGGDMTDGGTDVEWSDWWDDWQLTRSADGRMYPVVATRGNHEGSDAVVYNMFDTPSSNVYYALDIGGNFLRIYTLNTEISIAGNQTTWLTQDLQANDARVWKIAQYHKPMRPHEADKVEGTAQYSNWAGLFHQHRMNLVVECDAHVVKTTWPLRPNTGSGSHEGFIRDDVSGAVYVGEGTWGAPLRANNDVKPWTRASGSFNQVNWLRITPTKIELRKVRVDNAAQVGTVNDSAPYTAPANLDIWNAPNGSLVTLNPIPGSPTPLAHRPEKTAIHLSADRLSRSGGGAIRIHNLPALARVRVRDMQGTLVRALPQSEQPTPLAWNGRDASGNPAPTGLYHFEVEIPGAKPMRFPVWLTP